ncbi:MAG: S41 family peptidase [Defluviitaleaceae bacterium]|nr:S41 family peptidase [Defluviitaleaceae bacterium]
MQDKKSFLTGLGIGALISAVIVIIAFAGFTVHARQVRWRGLDPNTKITEIYGLLNRFSIVPFDKDDMLENMYRGLLAGVGDPYTQYFDAAALAAFHTRTEGAFVGIGITIPFRHSEDEIYVEIITVFDNAPAAQAGIRAGDKIISVDGTEVTGLAREDVISKITGPADTIVTLTILREDDRFDVEITRARVEVPSVFHEMLYTQYGYVGYIRIEGFERVTTHQFEAALSELYADGMSGLIIDVRNNPGGLLCTVTDIADKLMPEGIILYTIDAAGRRENSYSNPDYLGLPLVVLVNEHSASASEVLSGAIRDTQTGTIVGIQTYGKGIVQNLFILSDQTAIKLTVQKYFTPSGESIHGIGIVPHIIVEMPEELTRRIGSLPLDEDTQLQAALGVMDEKIR